MHIKKEREQHLSIRLDHEKCRGRDLNPRTTKDKTLNLTPLAKLGYPCLQSLLILA